MFSLISMTHYNATSLEVLSEGRARKVDVGMAAASTWQRVDLFLLSSCWVGHSPYSKAMMV